MQINSVARFSRLMLVHMLYSFIAAALAVMVPLYLVDRDIDIASIGITLSMIPLTFMIMRVVFASMADGVGTKKIGMVYSLSNMIAIMVYSVTTTPLVFIAATLAEGIRNSAFWAISRTEVLLDESKKTAAKVLAHFGGVRQVADGLGRLSIGLLIAFFSFQNSFFLLLALTLAMMVLLASHNNWKMGRLAIDRKMTKRVLANRPRSFWFNALGLTSMSITSNMLLAFLIPLYAYSQLGLSYAETGLMVAVFSLLTGLIMVAMVRKHIGAKRMLGVTATMVPLLAIFPFAGQNIILLVVLLAIGNGCSIILSEYILADAVAGSDEMSTDIGLTYMPLRVSEFLFMFLGGFVIAAFGYAPLFFICALCVAFFLLFARDHFK